MPTSTISPNMSLIIPTVGQEPGPDWATDLNASLSVIDAHDHSSGNGVAINPSGLDISSDLTFQNHNATNLRSTRFSTQSVIISDPADLRCLTTVGVDLFYIDGNGVSIQITQSGGISGTPGSISNLVAPASASYVAGTLSFVWQSDANTAANMDGGAVTIREVVTNGKGVTLNAPTGLSSDYDITFPSALPGSNLPLSLSNSGNLSAAQITAAQIVSNIALNGDISATGSISAGTSVSSATTMSAGTTLTIGAGPVLSNSAGTLLTSTALSVTGAIQSNNGGGLYPAGLTNAGLLSNATNGITVYSPSLGTSQFIVTSPTSTNNPISIIRGVVTGAGAISSGEGFTVNRTGAGDYTITYTEAFKDRPAIACGVLDMPGGTFQVIWAPIANLTPTSARVVIKAGSPTGGNSDCDFSFIITGQRKDV